MKERERVRIAANANVVRFGSIRAEMARFGVVRRRDMTRNMHLRHADVIFSSEAERKAQATRSRDR
jgi:hypothetical protein